MKNTQYRLRALLIGVTLGVLLFVIIPVHAALVKVPTGLSPGESYRLAFVTSGLTQAANSDINYYNNFVATAASAVPALDDLGATWRVIGSTSAVDAYVNTDTNPSLAGVPIYVFEI